MTISSNLSYIYQRPAVQYATLDEFSDELRQVELDDDEIDQLEQFLKVSAAVQVSDEDCRTDPPAYRAAVIVEQNTCCNTASSPLQVGERCRIDYYYYFFIIPPVV